MKKKITILTVMLAIFMLATYVYAATVGISLTSTTSTLNPGDEVVINLKTTSMDGLSNVRGYTATLSYDKDVFEEVTSDSVKGTSNIVEFNPTNGKMVVSCTSDVAETITLKVKSQVKSTNATVTVSNFVAIDDNEVESDARSASITFKVVGNISDEQASSNNTTNNTTNNTGTNTTGNTSGKINTTNQDKTISSTKLPKTGVTGYIAVVIAIIAIVAVVSIIRYKNIMK